MSEGVNRVTLFGNLGADPELRFTQGGQGVLNLRLATTESYLDKDKVRKERTDWHSIVLFGPRAEALNKFLTKGSRMLVEGRIQTSSYEDREGQKRYKTEIVATNIVLADGKRGGDEAAAPQKPAASRASGGFGGKSAPHAAASVAAGGQPDDFNYGSDDSIPF